MKLKDMKTDDIKKELEEISIFCRNNCLWVHENKRHAALLNEYERRVMGCCK